jgi:Molybdopterin-binding domain of aldehyde dehydrogenase
VSIRRDGTAHVRSAATDLGTGTYTIAAQVTAELLGLDIDQVQVEIGDSDLPPAPYSGGSGMATSLSGAIHDAVGTLVRAFLDLVGDDESSPLRGRSPDEVTTTNGGIHVVDAPSIGETYVDMLARHGRPETTADGERNPRANGASPPPSGTFAAWFAEVRVDAELGLLRVARIVSAVDAGRILNEKLARSQMIGGAVMGIGMTLLEETVFDPETGRIANATFGELPDPGQRGRGRDRRALRGHTRHGEASRYQGSRRDRRGRRLSRHRQRRVPRHRPAILSHGGLRPALKALARRSAVPVELERTSKEGFRRTWRWPRTTSFRRRSRTSPSTGARLSSSSTSSGTRRPYGSRFATTVSAVRTSVAAPGWLA